MVVSAQRHLVVLLQPTDGAQCSVLSAAALQATLRESVQDNFGDLGSGMLSGLHVRHYAAPAGLCLVRVPRQHAATARAALSLIRFVHRQPVRLTVLHCSGSALRVQKLLLQRLVQQQRAGQNDEQRRALQTEIDSLQKHSRNE